MKNPRKRYSGKERTISCRDEDWEQLGVDAARRGKSRSAWFVECALTEEIAPKKSAQRKLVLDATEQRSLSRAAKAIARGSHADGGRISPLADNLHTLFETRLRTMAREGRREDAVEALRTVLGEERAAVVAAAFLSEPPTTPGSPGRPVKSERKKTSRWDPPLLGLE